MPRGSIKTLGNETYGAPNNQQRNKQKKGEINSKVKNKKLHSIIFCFDGAGCLINLKFRKIALFMNSTKCSALKDVITEL